MHFLPTKWHESLPSTNSYLVAAIRETPDMPSGTVVATRCQTAGRGRYDRQWISSPDKNLAFSFVLRTNVPTSSVPALPVAIALAVTVALKRFGVDSCTKWPNDVLIEGRKICGILSEYLPELSDQLQTAVVGVGLNVNMTAGEADFLAKPATSILMETGAEVSVESVLDAVLGALPERIATWERSGFEGLRDDWTARTVGVGRRVAVGEGAQRKEGKLLGFGQFGELLLEDDAGCVQTVMLGDVTL